MGTATAFHSYNVPNIFLKLAAEAEAGLHDEEWYGRVSDLIRLSQDEVPDDDPLKKEVQEGVKLVLQI